MEVQRVGPKGGVAAVIDDQDSIESHVDDTLIAGAGLCHRNVVEHVVSSARGAIDWLVEQGVVFTKSDESFHLTRECTLAAGFCTLQTRQVGLFTMRLSVEQARLRTSRSTIILSLLIYTLTEGDPARPSYPGCYALNKQTGEVDTFLAHARILATGGASKVYKYTSNPDGASGDGIAMAWRAGCRVVNMEFNQFHPTCLFHPDAKSFLISEAVRGEGGILRLPDGTRFMPSFDPRAELAPRDIVARAIDHEMKRIGADHVYLDITHRDPELTKSHFPTIYRRLIELDIDMTQSWIPVVPAAHYTCGGVLVDLHGETDLAGLYAIGEVSSTGLHGANRMASNCYSNALCMVAQRRAISRKQYTRELRNEVDSWDASQVIDSDENVVVAHNWAEIRRFMWDYVGIVRRRSDYDERSIVRNFWQKRSKTSTLTTELPRTSLN